MTTMAMTANDLHHRYVDAINSNDADRILSLLIDNWSTNETPDDSDWLEARPTAPRSQGGGK